MPLAVFPKCFLDALVVHKTMTAEQWIAEAATLDIDGLEFFWGFTPREASKIKRIRSLVESRDLSIPMMCYSPDFTNPDPAVRKAEVAKEKRAIEVTASLGGKFCRVLSGQRWPGLPVDEGVRYAAEAITALLPHAQKHGVTLNLENHYKDSYWQYPEFAQKMEVFLKLLDAIPASPHFGVNYDPSNAIIAGEDPLVLLEAVKHRVVTMHASDRYFEGSGKAHAETQRPQRRDSKEMFSACSAALREIDAHPQTGYASILKHGVIGQGLNDYDRIFSILAGVGFKGWISIEDGQDVEHGWEHLRLSAEFLRKKMAQHGLV